MSVVCLLIVADLMMRYPSIRFGGQIVFSRTVSEVEEATLGLLEIIVAGKRIMDHVPVGFDIEWRPSFSEVVHNLTCITIVCIHFLKFESVECGELDQSVIYLRL